MQDAMEMSLDDYINSFQQPAADPKLNDSQKTEESKFKEGRRQQDDNEDEDELILNCEDGNGADFLQFDEQNDDLGMVREDPNDLRNKIVGRFPNFNSQQWRLMQPNVMQSRPAGMPPLVPAGLPPSTLSGNRGKWRNYNRNYRWNNNRNNNNNYQNNQNRIQRFNNNTRSNLNRKNIQIVLQQLKERNPMVLYSSVNASDLTIEATTERKQPVGIPRLTMPTVLKPNLSQVVTETEPSVSSKGSEAIKSLLGVSDASLRNDMMPALAGKLLDFLNGVNPTVHKPIYDMKIQKEIHEIQKKPLLYKCPGGEVVSSDGVGIANCRIQPKSSGISLNNRFA